MRFYKSKKQKAYSILSEISTITNLKSKQGIHKQFLQIDWLIDWLVPSGIPSVRTLDQSLNQSLEKTRNHVEWWTEGCHIFRTLPHFCPLQRKMLKPFIKCLNLKKIELEWSVFLCITLNGHKKYFETVKIQLLFEQ